MALKGRTWSELDKRFVMFINEKRRQDSRNLSLRTIEQLTGIKHGRLSGMLNMDSGVPTLDEFIQLCRLFNLSPSTVLDQLEKSLSKDDSDRFDIDVFIDEVVANPDAFDIAANQNDLKEIERETPRE